MSYPILQEAAFEGHQMQKHDCIKSYYRIWINGNLANEGQFALKQAAKQVSGLTNSQLSKVDKVKLLKDAGYKIERQLFNESKNIVKQEFTFI